MELRQSARVVGHKLEKSAFYDAMSASNESLVYAPDASRGKVIGMQLENEHSCYVI